MPELLAPAGDLEKMKFAYLYGADAIYCGGQNFSLRANAKNFSLEELKEASDFAHNLNKKIYVTVNIVFHDEDLNGLEEYLKYLDSINIDGIIASDITVIKLCQSLKLNLSVCLSTQASTLNSRTVKFWQNLGVTRVVLAREASREDLINIAKTGIERIRFTRSHPYDFSDELIDVIAKYPNIMKHIQLPVQSGDDGILKAMGRRYNRKQYLDLVKKIKDKIKDVSLTTDIIVGFPNESDEAFAQTLSLCEEVKYDSAFTFIYSPRVGTPAAKMKDNISMDVKKQRFNKLTATIAKYELEKYKTFEGKIIKVLVDGPSKKNEEILSGYSEDNKLVNFKGDLSSVGKIVNVKIIKAKTYTLEGEQVD